jgi:hypothetical protein
MTRRAVPAAFPNRFVYAAIITALLTFAVGILTPHNPGGAHDVFNGAFAALAVATAYCAWRA